MDAMLRGKAEELAKEIAVSISTQQELYESHLELGPGSFLPIFG